MVNCNTLRREPRDYADDSQPIDVETGKVRQFVPLEIKRFYTPVVSRFVRG